MLRSKHPLYSRWAGMINRCSNKKYHRYAGRGISVCERWLTFENFVEDMYSTFKPELSIDRINNDGNYEPSNCRWTDRETQLMNTQRSYNVSNEIRDVLRKRHITYAEYGRRIKAGMTHEEAIKYKKPVINRHEYYAEQSRISL
jgi:hypothetical protein